MKTKLFNSLLLQAQTTKSEDSRKKKKGTKVKKTPQIKARADFLPLIFKKVHAV